MKAIEICIKNGCKNGIPNQLCPYSSEVGCDLNQILADALELLKAQRETIDELISADKALKLMKEQDYRGWLMDMFHKYGRDDLIALLVLYSEENLIADVLKEQETKPLRCKECSYHRNDGWCNEHGREVKESDYCSFGAWEGR